jgi:hypothetical protein
MGSAPSLESLIKENGPEVCKAITSLKAQKALDDKLVVAKS